MPTHADRLLRCARLIASQAGSAPNDSELLACFLTGREPAAFEALVARHGPMVLRVCQHVLGNPHDAEDAFQATFLVLARKAASVRLPGYLASWLHGVACRVALGARTVARRRHREQLASDFVPPDPRPDPLAELTAREALQILEEEVQRLPEAYRLPVFLCCLQGLTQEDVARQLGWTPGSVKGRLERGRKLLRIRLTRRGLSLPAALLGTTLAQGTAPASLVASTVRAGLAFAAAGSGSIDGISPTVLLLAEGDRRGIATILMQLVVALTLTVGVAAASASLLIHLTPAADQPLIGQVAEPPQPEGAKQALDEWADDPLPAGAVARMGSIRFWSGSTVQSVAFAADGKTLASGHADGTVHLWQADTGKEIGVLQQPPTPVMALAFSSDGKLLATRGGGVVFQDNSIRLWEVSTGRELHRFGASPSGDVPGFEGSPSWAFRIAFSPDGKLLASGAGDVTSRDNLVRFWDVATGKELRQCRGHKGIIRCFAFASDGKTLASGSADRTVRLWDPTTGKELRRLDGHKGIVTALCYSPDGKLLVSGGEDQVIRLWEADGGKELNRLKVAGPVQALRFTEDRTLAWGDKAGVIHLVDVKTGKELRQSPGHLFGVSDLRLSPNGKVLASVGIGQDSSAYLWDVPTGKRLSPPTDAHVRPVSSVAFPADGRTLVSGSWDGTVRFWNPRTGKEVRPAVTGLYGVFGLAYSPDCKLLAVLTDEIRVWEADTLKEMRRLKHPGSGSFRSIAFAPDGKTLLTGGERLNQSGKPWEGAAGFWDVATGNEIRLVRGNGDGITSVAIAPDGKTFASGGADKTVRVWESATGKEVHRLQGHQATVTAVVFSPHGEVLASASGESIRLWESATGKELRKMELGDTRHAEQIAFSPDGRLLASGDFKEGWIVRLWEVQTGKEVRRWEGHRGQINGLAFAPDGRTLASGSHDAMVLVWDVTGLLEKGQFPKETLTRQELEKRWEDLGAADAAQGQHAVWRLALSPGQSVAFLGDRIRPVPIADARQIARLISDLDSDQFKTREGATRELERLAEGAEPQLRKTLQNQSSPEVRSQVERLLEKLDTVGRSPEWLRTVRGLQVLGCSSTPEARQVLQALAKGGPGARLTREATAALDRLNARP